MAQSLLHAEAAQAAHVGVLRSAFLKSPALNRLTPLADRTLAWTATRPSPRARTLARQLGSDDLWLSLLERHSLRPDLAPLAPRMRLWPGMEALPRLDTVGDLAAWLRTDVPYLLWMADLHNRNRRHPELALRHYHLEIAAKPSGGVRVLEKPKQYLKHLQREILRGILNAVSPHEAAHGFRRARSIVTFAQPHLGKRALVRLDLQNFFPTISGPRVQSLFRTLGYPEHVADVLGSLCTTTTPQESWRNTEYERADMEQREQLRTFYARPHLPQGAPTSPAIANLCALHFDRRLAALARAAGATYTRYADDLAFSGDAGFARRAGVFAVRAAAILQEEGFPVQHRKTRLMHASGRQHLAGLTVNAHLNAPRKEWDRLKATLTNCVRHGPETQNREAHADLRLHLEGKVNFMAMVNPRRARVLRSLLERIEWTRYGN